MRSKDLFGMMASVVILGLLIYGVLHFLKVDVGRVIDWGVGIASLCWIMIIVTVPWNAHFRAKEVLDDAHISQRKNILVIEESLEYARRVARNSLWIAIALHLFTGAGLYAIAASGISPVGYFAAGAAIALTVLRPTVRFYEYLQRKLSDIQQEFRYPREDLRELLGRVDDALVRLQTVETTLSTEKDVDSWRKAVDENLRKTTEELDKLKKQTNERITKTRDELLENDKKISTEVEAARQEARFSLDKLTTDSKVLDAVRDLVGFLKKI